MTPKIWLETIYNAAQCCDTNDTSAAIAQCREACAQFPESKALTARMQQLLVKHDRLTKQGK
jgi:hypothetical protein